jgi:hypothetical protein
MNKTIQTEDTTEEKHVVKTVSMYPEQWTVVDEVNERYGFRSVSNALRFIVDKFARAAAE